MNKYEQELQTVFDLQMKKLEENLNRSHEELKAFLAAEFKGQEAQVAEVFDLSSAEDVDVIENSVKR